MNRRQLLISIPAVTACLIPAMTSAVDPQVFILSLPFIISKGQEWLLPRARQLRDAVDDSLGHLRNTTSRLRFTLLNQQGKAIGEPVTYNEAFLRGPAIGILGAGTILREVGMSACDERLDEIRSVRVEALPGVYIDMTKESAKRFGKMVIFADGTFAAGYINDKGRESVESQIQLARQIPDLVILLPYNVINYADFLKGRIISMPGATSEELCDARDAVSRGDSIVWNREVKFC